MNGYDLTSPSCRRDCKTAINGTAAACWDACIDDICCSYGFWMTINWFWSTYAQPQNFRLIPETMPSNWYSNQNGWQLPPSQNARRLRCRVVQGRVFSWVAAKAWRVFHCHCPTSDASQVNLGVWRWDFWKFAAQKPSENFMNKNFIVFFWEKDPHSHSPTFDGCTWMYFSFVQHPFWRHIPVKSRWTPLRMALAPTNPDRNGSEPRRVEEAGGLFSICAPLHLDILTRWMDPWCFNQHTEPNRRTIKIEIWCYDGMTSIDFPKSLELLKSRSYILDPKTDTSEQPHLHPNCEHHLGMVRMWERRIIDLIYCCWVIQVALASKVGYKAVDDYVKSGPLGLQGETPVSEDWRIQKPTNISVFVGEENNDNLFTPIGDTGWVSAEAWSSAWGQAPLRVLARMLVVTVPVRHRFIWNISMPWCTVNRISYHSKLILRMTSVWKITGGC